MANETKRKLNEQYRRSNQMKSIINLSLLICLALFSISLTKPKEAESSQSSAKLFPVKIDSLNMFDSTRNRLIPVAFYFPITDKVLPKQKVINF